MAPNDSNPRTIVIQAIQTNDLNQIRSSIENGFNINQTDASGNTLLMLAIAAGNHRAALFIINHGADLLASNHAGKTALDLAREFNMQPILTRLLLTQDQVNQGFGPPPLLVRQVGMDASWNNEELMHSLSSLTLQEDEESSAAAQPSSAAASAHVSINPLQFPRSTSPTTEENPLRRSWSFFTN